MQGTNHIASRRWPSALVALVGLVAGAAVVAEPIKTAYSRVELIAEQATLPANGGAVTLGLHIEPDPSWHAYWMNPGDAGLPASVRWHLPEGFAAAELQFPAPHLIPFGELVTYAFDEPILLLSKVTVPAGLAVGATVTLRSDARWVVCDDKLCVPERATVSVSLPVGDGGTHAERARRFQAARAELPEAVAWPAWFERLDGAFRITVQTPQSLGSMEDPYLFVASRRLVKYAEQTVSFAPQRVVFSMREGIRADRATDFGAVLKFRDSGGADRAVWLDVGAVPPVDDPVVGPTTEASPASPMSADMSLGVALLFAFIGGVILNLMPCVFPILSVKALSLVKMGHTDLGLARHSGLLYTAGILVAFAVFAGILVGFRAAGQAAGWGFQMQSPLVNLGLGLLMVAIALNLLGVFEIGMRLAGVGQTLTAGGERKAAFFTGLLAVLVATPCTAPFMAAALGYALMQPAPMTLAIFLMLGLGLAFPYLLLSFVPSFGRAMPRPGSWMATFRSVLAFPMFATAVWLFWIIGKQLGASAMAVGLLAALSFAFALWAYGRTVGGARPWAWRTAAALGLVATLVVGADIGNHRTVPAIQADDRAGTLGQLELERFTPERVTGYIDSGQPVFLYFTADWCVSCKVNERVALASDAVGAAFRERDIRVVEGDWTNEDPVITDWLDRYGRVGVPLYLYFPRGSSLGSPAVLPQLLLPDIVIQAIDRADAASPGEVRRL